MSADSVHADAEHQIKRKKHVYDSDDFCQCIASTKADVVRLRHSDFFASTGQHSQAKLGKARWHLSCNRVIQLRRGSNHLFDKKRHTDEELFDSCCRSRWLYYFTNIFNSNSRMTTVPIV